MNTQIKDHLLFLYGSEKGPHVYDQLCRIMEESRKKIRAGKQAGKGLMLDERDSILITYGDQFRKENEAPLKTLGVFLEKYLKGVISGVHILPFSPYSSDDGFSVIDFRAVNPEWGDWSDIGRLDGNFRLMFDLVLNHISAKSRWFEGFLKDEEKYKKYFITIPEGTDLSLVFRPRALPLLTQVETPSGKKLVWTTFSADQIDLNYENPELLLEMIGILLFYIEQGAHFIRLDAIAYLWKEIGTSCIHLEQTHRVVQLFRAIFDVVAPWVMIITETNVPHPENISYFGDGTDEAQMVYQFSLPPLVLDAFTRGDAGHLSSWASSLGALKGNITFFNFLASHDGIGMLPAHGIMKEDELQGLAEQVKSHKGFVSYKSTPKGDIPYELNISYFNAIVNPDDSPELKVQKFLASQAIMLAFSGVPGIYIHSLLGTPNYLEGVKETGANRTINRKKLNLDEVEQELSKTDSIQSRIFKGYIELLRIRSAHPAFHPFSEQIVLNTQKSIFAFLRVSPDRSEKILCLFNTGPVEERFTADAKNLGITQGLNIINLTENFTGDNSTRSEGSLEIFIPPYRFLWLKLAH